MYARMIVRTHAHIHTHTHIHTHVHAHMRSSALEASEDIRLELSGQLARTEEGVAGRMQLLLSQVGLVEYGW